MKQTLIGQKIIQVHEIVDEPASKETLKEKVNRWLQENNNLVGIVDIKYSIANSESHTTTAALIIYKEVEL